jgi:drug/metabolite transporter (DMT)-like permease
MLGAALVIGQYALQDLALGFGTLLGLGAGIFYGAYFLVTQLGRKNLDALSYFWISILGATVLLFVINIVLGQPLLGYPKETYLSLFALGVVSQGAGWLAINFAQGLLPATLVAPTLLAQPVITAFLARPILGETHNPWQVMGGLWVIAGIYLVHRSREATNKVDQN